MENKYNFMVKRSNVHFSEKSFYPERNVKIQDQGLVSYLSVKKNH